MDSAVHGFSEGRRGALVQFKEGALGSGGFRRRVYDLRSSRLLEAAKDLIHESGCQQVRVEDVASACGVAKGTYYRHFRTREELLATAVSALDGELATHIIAVADGAPGCDGLESAVSAALLAVIQNLRRRVHAGDGLSARSWPCCLQFSCCPFGGAPKSQAAISAVAESATGREEGSLRLAIELVMSVPVVMCARGHVDSGDRPSPEFVVGAGLEMMRSLIQCRG
jgi:AcrR family transcriptional regulator